MTHMLLSQIVQVYSCPYHYSKATMDFDFVGDGWMIFVWHMCNLN